jgi:hypothetical protein
MWLYVHGGAVHCCWAYISLDLKQGHSHSIAISAEPMSYACLCRHGASRPDQRAVPLQLLLLQGPVAGV